MGAIGVVKVRIVGIIVFAAVLGSSRMSMVKKIDVRNSPRIVLGNYRKKRKRRSVKDKRHIPIASVSCSSLPSSSLESKTFILVIGSSSESSRTSLDPSLEDKSTLGFRVAELGMDKGMTTEEQSFIA